MSDLLWLPALVRNEHDRSNPWTERTDPKGCLHTTEGGGWPTYSDWTIMPHGTIWPIPGKGIKGRQHLPLNQGSFSLRNLEGGVQTNRDYVFQWELIGTCEKNGAAYKAGAYYWPDADDAVLLDLYRKVIKPLSDAYGIPIRCQPWQAYPASYGARSGTNNVRMAGSDFDNWSGWLGHQHVPENVHGDPGAFPWDRMMAAVAAADKEDDDMEQGDPIKLTEGMAKAMNLNLDKDAKKFKAGDTITVGRSISWGGPGMERLFYYLRVSAGRETAADTKLDALTAAVRALTVGSPEGVKAAFEEGVAAFDAAVDKKFADLDLHLTIDDDDVH